MILGTATPNIDYLYTVLEEEARLDMLNLRRFGVRHKVPRRALTAPTADKEDGRGLQRRSNVVAFLGGLSQQL
jgi:hypothetical protein